MKFFAQILLLGGLLFIRTTSPVWAATSVSIHQAPSAMDKEQEGEIDITLVCTGCTSDSYIRGVFYPSGTSYFGFTQNKENVWTNAAGSGCTSYYKIAPSDLVDGSWSGKLKVKPDVASSYFAGPGEYLFKIGRYTASCNSPIWSSEVTIAITGATPTPTLQPTATFTPTTAPTSTLTVVAQTKTPTPSISLAPSLSPEVLGAVVSTDSSGPSVVLATVTQRDKDDARDIEKNLSMMPFILSLVFVSFGCAMLSGVFIWQKRHFNKKI
jgi:hypothetical protein